MTMNLTNRNIYKSIVIGMSICLPLGVGFGIIYNQVLLGILLGNSAGVIIGIIFGNQNDNKEGKRI
jgi:hypothetical protein